MNDKDYKQIDFEQKKYHNLIIGNQLLLETNHITSDSVNNTKRSSSITRKSYYKELSYFHRNGADITIGGRILNKYEFNAAAELLASGNLSRQIVYGKYIHTTKYKIY